MNVELGIIMGSIICIGAVTLLIVMFKTGVKK